MQLHILAPAPTRALSILSMMGSFLLRTCRGPHLPTRSPDVHTASGAVPATVRVPRSKTAPRGKLSQVRLDSLRSDPIPSLASCTVTRPCRRILSTHPNPSSRPWSPPTSRMLEVAPHQPPLKLVFLSCWPREAARTGPSLGPLSPPTGPMPGTPTERDVDDAARKGHKEPVTLGVQLQPHDPPCCLGGPLPTAPRVRPAGVRRGRPGQAPFSRVTYRTEGGWCTST